MRHVDLRTFTVAFIAVVALGLLSSLFFGWPEFGSAALTTTERPYNN
jgi:hypothetical protein